ncbi:hypothetical protein [Pelosinus sp. UFO1]|uniref:hypothetical protein n=1 Tax=Pelosinus sp. UFO1 TaxID=484770 RepID=UPI00056EAAB3|nr:hypothetical protein [Pelosinus sp. UFO1]
MKNHYSIFLLYLPLKYKTPARLGCFAGVRRIYFFGKIIVANPKQESAYYLKAKALMDLKRTQEAIAAFRQYIQIGTDIERINDAKAQLLKLGVEP